MQNDQGAQLPVACDMTAITPAEREAHQVLTRHLFEVEARERRELANGYAFRFDGELFDQVCRFVANERLCCPFWSFAVEVAPESGPIWLRLSGPEGAKALLE